MTVDDVGVFPFETELTKDAFGNLFIGFDKTVIRILFLGMCGGVLDEQPLKSRHFAASVRR